MKNLIVCLALLFTTIGFSQSKTIKGMVVNETVKAKNLAITVTVDSADDIESTFKTEDIEEIFDHSANNEILTFKIICNSDTMSNGKKAHVSYEIEGKSDEREQFIKGVEKIRAAAIKYYKNKN